MSESGEKHFDPTPSRLAKAKREGNAPHATEFAANAAFAAAALATCAIVAPAGALAAAAIRDAARGKTPIAACAALVGYALVPIAAAAACATLAASVQHGGIRIAALKLSIDRMNPVEGIKRMCSRDAASHAARACIAFTLAACAVVPAVRSVLEAGGTRDSVRSLAGAAFGAVQHIVLATLAVGALFAIAEYGIARAAWIKKLRMSFAEYKREMKEQDGDPALRGKRRSLHRSFVRGALERVKDASFVIVNPTHVAIALEYGPPNVPVPTVLVRAADEGALRVRELATRYRVPIVENVALARALYAQSRVGEPIAHAHYVAVAEIVAALRKAV